MKILISLFTIFASFGISAQSIIIEGVLQDETNKRFLDGVEVNIYDMTSDGFVASTVSANDGSYTLAVPANGSYALTFNRKAYYPTKEFFESDENNIIHDVKMARLPGYEFEGTIRELMSYNGKGLGKELKNTKIEIYNNTTSKEVSVDLDDPENTFIANFERNNHYTILIRKNGYFAKRIEAYVDVEGCIICFEGLGDLANLEIESALTDSNQRGSIITDIAMKKIIQDEGIVLDNIYYDYNKWNIRKDATQGLEKLIGILKRNPIIIELGSHTDSRGKDDFNRELSEKRAAAAVDYIMSRGIKATRLSSQGYGESVLLNDCDDSKKCSEAEHQKNRRTEFKVTAFVEDSSFDNKSLAEIIEEENKLGKKIIEQLSILQSN